MQNVQQRPWFISFTATALGVLYKVLPRSVYDSIYRFMFGHYKARQRSRYRREAVVVRGVDPDKAELIYNCMEHSLVGHLGLEITYDKIKEIISRGLPGALVECGVAQGGSALLIALVAAKNDPGRQIWLFDSYEGLPEPTKEDFSGGKTGTHVRPLPKGSCLGTVEDVRELLFQKNQLSSENIHLVKGWFQNTLMPNREQIGPIALLRLDGDWYDSTMVCLERLFDQVCEGGFILIDDYFSCFGCKKATDEFLAARGKNFPIVPDGRGGAFFCKSG